METNIIAFISNPINYLKNVNFFIFIKEDFMGRVNNKQLLIDSKSSIQKSNELSMAKLNQGLSLNQMQLLSYAILCTQKNGITEFQKNDFEKIFNIEKYQTKQAKIDSSKVLSIQFSLEDLENDSFEYCNVFRKMKYGKGKFTFVWDQDVIPHILEIKDKYVLTDLSITSKFKSSFSWILYDYLRGSYGYWYITFTKETIMKLFGVDNKKSYLENTGLFKKRVLDRAISEINKFTELEVSYEEIKSGKAITSFKLLWSVGINIPKASKNQIEILSSLISTIFYDTLMYGEIKNDENRGNAISIIRELRVIQTEYLSSSYGLTAEFCKQLLDKANNYLSRLNYYLEVDGKPKLEPMVPLFNWLEKQ